MLQISKFIQESTIMKFYRKIKSSNKGKDLIISKCSMLLLRKSSRHIIKCQFRRLKYSKTSLLNNKMNPMMVQYRNKIKLRIQSRVLLVIEKAPN